MRSNASAQLVCTAKTPLSGGSFLLTMEMRPSHEQGQSTAGSPRKQNRATALPKGILVAPMPPTPFYSPQYPAYVFAAAHAPGQVPAPGQVAVVPRIGMQSSRAPHPGHMSIAQSRPVSHGWPERAVHPLAASFIPPALPTPRPGFIKRTVPQLVWDPYQKQRSKKNAKDVVIHHFPNGVTPLDTHRITFDLVGQAPGSGIPLALLDVVHIDATLCHLVDANEPILIDRQRLHGDDCEVEAGHSYNYIDLCMAWPAYLQHSKTKFRCTLTIRDVCGYSSRARILKDCSRHITHFFEYAQRTPSTTARTSEEDMIWAFGPSGLSFDTVRLVSLFQMAGQFFLGEFDAEISQEVWDRRLNEAKVPMVY
ncbi:uncharacterized protein C8Q71DRAFT_783665 [Rhodofomes roseus]|uniref:Uncharacterized protein n=1 Tax=Rhodofomes roseus TaxID=34475 RepID=A0ABQ8K2E5_9APHY|nr:uncharacterized protein C8Q71DRAFT_783665 [Rhodofomes roseus]KAH9830902.1 hypothetical protein C8Q71DRAFT_783665 [Rhodofomes roseus]